jgi:vitamin B12 transporter
MRQILLAAGILGGAMPGLLAQPVPTSPQTPPAAQGARFADSVVVTTSPDAEPRDDVPAAVTVIDGEEIRTRQARTLADLLWSVPGLHVATAGAPGQQTSVFTRGANSNQTLLLWNGIPLNDPFFGDINWQFVPTEGVERVEVVRGPFSALYGSNAVGGVVQLLTGSRRGGILDLEGGERGYLRGGLAAGADLGGTRLDLTGHVRRDEGRLANDFYDGQEVMARALWAPQPGASVGALVRANDSRTGVPFSLGVPTPETTISWQERELALPFAATGGRWTADGQLSDTRFDATFRSPDDPFGAFDSDTRSQALRGRAVGSYHLVEQQGQGQDLVLSLGTEVERFQVTNKDNSGTNLDHAHQRTWAGFGQAGYGAGPVHLDLGLRRDDNDVYGGQTSLRAGGVARLAAHTRLRASYGQAFRAPSLGELYFPFGGNPGLKPETATSYEVGIEHQQGPWRLAVTGFDNHQRNLIVFETFRDVNVGRARSRGLEGEVGFRRGIVSALLNATQLEAVDQSTGLGLLRRPKSSANLLLTVRPAAWVFNFTGRYVGRRPDLDPVTGATRTNPGFVRLDLAASWRALPWLAPFVRLENLADRDYSEVLGYPSPRRTLVGGVTVEL